MIYVAYRRRLVRALAALLALLAGFAAAVTPAVPAAAGPGGGPVLVRTVVGCWEELEYRDGIPTGRVIVRCLYELDLESFEPETTWPEIPPIPDPYCPVCAGVWFDFRDTLSQDRQVVVLESLEAGFDLLGEAERATEPEQVAALRTGAMEKFATGALAAVDSDGTAVLPEPVAGYVVEEGVFEPADLPELSQAGTLVVEAMAMLATDPDIDPASPAGELLGEAFDMLSRVEAG